MPMERMSMRRVRDCIRLKTAGMATREIARRLGVASSTVRLTLRCCEMAGITWPLEPDVTDLLYKPAAARASSGEWLSGLPIVIAREENRFPVAGSSPRGL